jgi:hypothetical protein
MVCVIIVPIGGRECADRFRDAILNSVQVILVPRPLRVHLLRRFSFVIREESHHWPKRFLCAR